MNKDLLLKQFPALVHSTPFDFAPESVSFITGDPDSRRISLQYFQGPEDQVYGLAQFGPLAQGPPEAAHGGAIAAVFDELMGATCWQMGVPALTAQFTTRYFSTLPLNEPILFSCKIHKQADDRIKLKAHVMDAEGNRFAEAKGLFIALDEHKLKALFPQAGGQESK